MSIDRTRTYPSLLPTLLIAVIGVCSFVATLDMPLLGDDLKHGLTYAERLPHWYQWPLVVPMQWLSSNSRMADMAGNILLAQAPSWLLAALVALFCAALYHNVSRAAVGPGNNRPAARLWVMCALMLTLPWWDSFFLYVVHFNYLWVSVLTIYILRVITGDKALGTMRVMLMCMIALPAGWGHEASGMPVVAGLVIYLFVNRHHRVLAPGRWAVVAAFVLGALLSVSSPASYARLGRGGEADAPLWILLGVSCFYAVALVVMTGSLLCSRSGRRLVSRLMKSEWSVYAVAACASMLFVALGGIIGRSGWFAQVYAIIAIAMTVRESGMRVSGRLCGRLAATVLFILLAGYEIADTVVACDARRQLTATLEQYDASADGTVYSDATRRDDFAAWTLRRHKACIDNDDYYLIEVVDGLRGGGNRHYRLLPVALRDIIGGDIDSVTPMAGGYVSPTRPTGIVHDNIVIRDDIEHTVTEFTSGDGVRLYYIEPRVTDPGDR